MNTILRFIDAADRTIDMTSKDRYVRWIAKSLIRLGIVVVVVGLFLSLATILLIVFIIIETFVSIALLL